MTIILVLTALLVLTRGTVSLYPPQGYKLRRADDYRDIGGVRRRAAEGFENNKNARGESRLLTVLVR